MSASLAISTLTVANQAALAALSVKSIVTGQFAFCTAPAPGLVFVLQPATPGAANGVNVVATLDDPNQQWVQLGIFNGFQNFSTPILDFTQAQSVTLMPAIAGYYPIVATQRYSLTATAGTLTTSPTWQMGSDAGNQNVGASNAPNLATAFATGAPVSNAGGNVLNPSAQQVAGAPLVFKITAGATGTGLTLMGRIIISGAYVPV